jgi:hypothetical protein
MRFVALAVVLCCLPACAAKAPEPPKFTMQSLVWHLRGPNGFIAGPFSSLPQCEAVRTAYTVAGKQPQWDAFRCA